MIRSSSFVGPARRLVSALAMSAALAGASLGAAMVLTAPAAAQEYSEGFVELYTPIEEVVNAEGGDAASVAGQLPALVTAAQSPDERFAAGNLVLQVGNKSSNPQLQRQGLELMVASGQTTPEQLAQFQFFIGSLAYNAQDYPAARTALEAAQAAGYSAPDADIPGLIAESYFAEGDIAGGIEHIRQASGGGQVPEQLLLLALQNTYEQEMVAEATEVAALLVTSYPTDRNWLNALQIVNALNEFPPAEQLDLLRLMRETRTLTDRTEYVRYIEAADPRIMANEVTGVLAEAVAAGQLSATDPYYTEVKSIADQRGPVDQREAPGLVTQAQGSADPRDASDAGEVHYSLDDFAQAEAMYQLALDKGHPERDTILTRLGMAQARQGKFAEAQATLAQVTGQRAPIAQMWSLYAQAQGGGPAQAAAPAPAPEPAAAASPAE